MSLGGHVGWSGDPDHTLAPISTIGIARYAAAGGLEVDELLAVARTARDELETAALALNSYDPECDRDDRVPEVAARMIESVV